MEDYSKLVIELYREQFLAYTVGLPVNVDSIFSVQDCLLKAIDKAKVNNEPTDYLVNLKNEVDFLKYQILRYLKSATTRLYDTEAKIICIVSKKGAQCIECHHKDI